MDRRDLDGKTWLVNISQNNEKFKTYLSAIKLDLCK
jgi:hypothetical protein